MIRIDRIERHAIVGAAPDAIGANTSIDVYRGEAAICLSRSIAPQPDGSFRVEVPLIDLWEGPALTARLAATNTSVEVGPDASAFVNVHRSFPHPRDPHEGSLVERLVGNVSARPAVPQALIDYVAGGGTNASFYAVGAALALDLLDFGVVRSRRDQVFELGAGCGRVALGICPALDVEAGGRYAGFEIYADAVRWAQEVVTPLYPAATFRRIGDAGGYDASRAFAMDLPGASQDALVATSVFTHLRYPAARAYAEDIARILKPGGRGYITFFASKDIHRSNFEKAGTDEDDYGFHYKNVQAEDTYVDEAAAITMLEESGLRVLGVKYGSWRQKPCSGAYEGYQDVFLVAR